jgi:hypothetical protein
MARNSQALDSFLGKKTSALTLKYFGRVSKNIKSDNYPKCGNWCRKYPMRFSGNPPVMDSLDQACQGLLTCFRDTEWSCDCLRKFSYDIYANRDPNEPVSDNEDYVFFYFTKVAQCTQ